MKSTVEQLSPTRVRINVEVPFTELQPDFDRAYKQLAQQVRLPGFRPGKAPAKLLEARIGRGAVLEQVVNDALPIRYTEAVTSSDVQPIGQPEIEITKIEDGDELVFTAEVDVRPKIELPELDAVTIDRRSRRSDRRGRGVRVGVAARPLRHADRCRTGRADRRLRVDRPVGDGRRRGGARGGDRRAVARGRVRSARRGSRRRDRRVVGRGEPRVHHHAGRGRTRRPERAGDRHRELRQGTRAAGAPTTNSRNWQANSTRSTS